MKVLWFSNTPALGAEYLNRTIDGTGGWLASLDKQLQNKVELSVAFLYPYNIKPFKHKNTNYYPIYTGNIIIGALKGRWLSCINENKFSLQYKELIEEIKPDIIHIHGTENTFTSVLKDVEKPVAVSIQGITTVISKKYKVGFEGRHIRVRNFSFDIKSLLFGNTNFNLPLKKISKISKIERENLLYAQNIIGRTDWDRRVTRILAPNSKYFVIHEVFRDKFYLSCWQNDKPTNRLILHTTNGNSYFKGFETLCYALSLLNNLGLDVEWRVAGVSENSLINKVVKRELKDKYPKKGLRLLGHLNEIELVDKLREAHFYIMTSHIENSPNNLTEAMILGMPCIATNAGGTSSLLTDKKEGILIQDGDPWVMAGAILELKENWDKAVEYGKNARERALVRHDRQEIVMSLLETYKLIIKEYL